MTTAEILAVGGLLLTVLLAYMQIQRNGEAALKLQEEHLRNELKLKIYERASAVFDEAGVRLSTVSVQYFAPLSSLDMRIRKGFPVAPTNRGTDLSNDFHASARAMTRVLHVLEEYEVVFSRFRTIRNALSDGHQRMLEAQNALWSKLMVYLPFVDATSGQAAGPLRFPTLPELEAMEALHETFRDVCGEVSGYLIDVQIEAQNELLGPLFAKQLPPRNPEDDRVRVLSRDAEDARARPRGRLI